MTQQTAKDHQRKLASIPNIVKKVITAKNHCPMTISRKSKLTYAGWSAMPIAQPGSQNPPQQIM